MSLADLKAELENIENKISGWLHPATTSLNTIKAKFGAEHHQAILDLLTKAHQQAKVAIANGANATRGDIPWELAHGLSVLNLLDGTQPLPRTRKELETIVLKDGSLLGCRQWELLDPRWAEALVQWLEHLNKRATFVTTPAVITMANDVVLAIAGDWGTGPFEPNAPATKVAKAMCNTNADYTIHLGDVYYEL